MTKYDIIGAKENGLDSAGVYLYDDDGNPYPSQKTAYGEVGKRDTDLLKKFLSIRYKAMPRTMLRYAIEKFPEEERRAYLKGTA